MEILTGEQMRRVDRRAIEILGISSLTLMEAAGRGVALALRDDFPSLGASDLVILCGKGNNGGDGFVAARYLAGLGVTPHVLLLAHERDLAPDATVNYRALRQHGVAVQVCADEAAWGRERVRVEGAPLVLDAMLGTGVRGGARGLVARAIEDLNRSHARVVSIDLPSGMNSDSTESEGVSILAHGTYTLCRPKFSLLLGDAASNTGWLRVVPIGIPDEAVLPEHSDLEWLEPQAARGLLATREPDGHKGRYGHLLGIAGSRGKSGAAVLLARGALRSGVGLVTMATARGIQAQVAAQQAEMMTEPLPESPAGGLSSDSLPVLTALCEGRDALALGPGLGTEDETCEVVTRLLATGGKPAVVDADALNAMARERGPSSPWPGAARLVLTPHPGEAGRLLRTGASEVQARRLDSVRRLAQGTGATVVLKGRRTLIARPDGRVAVNSTGNPGMATAGSGDVLTGMIGALLARGMSCWDSARLAAFVHGDAGDRAARKRGIEGLIASDIVEHVRCALAGLRPPDEPARW